MGSFGTQLHVQQINFKSSGITWISFIKQKMFNLTASYIPSKANGSLFFFFFFFVFFFSIFQGFFLFYSEIYSFDEYLMCYLDQILCMFHERIIKIDKRKSCCSEISTSNNIWFHSRNYRMPKYFGSLFSSSKTGIKRSASC